MSQIINRFVGVLETFITHPDVDEWKRGHYYFSASQDSDGYYGYVSYRGNNVARIVLPPPGTQGKSVVLLRSLGYHTQCTSRTIGAVLKATRPELRVNIKRGKLTLNDGRLVPAVEWLEV